MIEVFYKRMRHILKATSVLAGFLACGVILAADSAPVAPTRIPLGMLAAPFSPVGSVLIVLPDGSFRLAKLVGAAIVSDVNGLPIIQISSPPVTSSVYSASLTKVSQYEHTMPESPKPGTERIYRNGLRLKLGADYTIEANRVTWLPNCDPQPGDIVQVDYEKTASEVSSGVTGR